MEGVVFNMVSLMDKLKSFQTVKRVVTSGSITRLPFVYKLLSTLIEVPVDRGSTLNASLIGALRIVMGEESNVKNKARLEGNVTKNQLPLRIALMQRNISNGSNYAIVNRLKYFQGVLDLVPKCIRNRF